MAKLRKFIAYRKLERPYTRKSKFKEKSYIKASPHLTINRFDMGNPRKKYEYTFTLVSKQGIQIRHNALEAARQTSNRLMEKTAGVSNYHMKVRVFPHHILRENPLAAGAGADRMSMGMSLSFGKPISAAAQVREGQTIIELKVDKQYIDTAKKALKRASYKLPCSYLIQAVQQKN